MTKDPGGADRRRARIFRPQIKPVTNQMCKQALS